MNTDELLLASSCVLRVTLESSGSPMPLHVTLHQAQAQTQTQA